MRGPLIARNRLRCCSKSANKRRNGEGEGGIGTKVAALHIVQVAGNHPLQYRLSTFGTVHVARAQRAALHVAMGVD